jgi:hypothetical protein
MTATRVLFVIAALGMTLAGCGGSSDADQAAEASASADAVAEPEAEVEAEAEAEAARQKSKDTKPRVAQTSASAGRAQRLDSRLGIGMNQDDFSGDVGDASVAYDRIPFSSMKIECRFTAGIKLEDALNDYIKTNNAWQECNEDLDHAASPPRVEGSRTGLSTGRRTRLDRSPTCPPVKGLLPWRAHSLDAGKGGRVVRVRPSSGR